MEKSTEKKNNFRTALDEIVKGKLNTTSNNQEKERLPEETLYVTPVEPVETLVHKEFDKLNKEYKPNQSSESTIISEGTIIEGSIITKANLIIQGDVNGDVESEKDIEIIGHIMGNVKGNNTTFLKGSINGNVSGPKMFTMTKESKVTGDISCQELECDGSITGNVNASNSVYLGANSMIKGNVTAKSISVKEGAQIKGSLEIL